MMTSSQQSIAASSSAQGKQQPPATSPAAHPAPAPLPARPPIWEQFLQQRGNPCKFWCQSCAFGHSCIAVGAGAIWVANLMGIYFLPTAKKCFESYIFQQYIKDWKPNEDREPRVNEGYPKQEHFDGVKTKCEAIIYSYITFNVLSDMASISAGVLLHLAVFQRRALFAFISAIIFAASLALIIVQGSLVFILSYARYWSDEQSAWEDYKMYHPMCINPFTGQEKCDRAPAVGLLSQQLLSAFGALGFFAGYLYLAYCAWAYQLFIKANLDLFAGGGGGAVGVGKPGQVTPLNSSHSKATPQSDTRSRTKLQPSLEKLKAYRGQK